MKKLIFMAGLASIAVGASAQTLFWSGNTTGGPTFARPTSMSTVAGTSTFNYHVQPFWVTVSGTYVMELNSGANVGQTNPDCFALAYGATWNAATPLVGLLNGDDDFSAAFSLLAGTGQGFRSSRIAAGDGSNFNTSGLVLSANQQYYAVVTSFSGGQVGTYLGAIGGGSQGGQVRGGLVPEPASMAALGLGALALIRRRRSKQAN